MTGRQSQASFSEMKNNDLGLFYLFAQVKTPESFIAI